MRLIMYSLACLLFAFNQFWIELHNQVLVNEKRAVPPKKINAIIGHAYDTTLDRLTQFSLFV